jgi:plastocyanin
MGEPAEATRRISSGIRRKERMRTGTARTLVTGVLACLIGAVPAAAGTANVDVADSAFSPDAIGNQVGDAVLWSSDGTIFQHNVREDGQLFRSGAPTSMPFDFTVVFSAGTFHYYCEIHGSPDGGMDGLVRIPVAIARAPAGLPFTVVWATEASETGDSYEVQFRVGSGDWRRWRRNTTVLNGVFGRNRAPVRVRDGVRYSFRARSREGGVTSRWAPVRSFRP